jgi:hypothetical protein
MSATADLRQHLQLVLRLADHLETVGGEIVSQEHRYESFGSWSLVVRRSGNHFRVDFDGRDRVLLVYRVLPASERSTRAPELRAEEPLPMGLTTESLARVCNPSNGQRETAQERRGPANNAVLAGQRQT